MARINVRIDECVSQKFTGGPRYRTDTIPMDNGDEVRNRVWKYPKHEYVAEYLNFSQNERDEIIAMQHVAAGSWLDFRFKDWMDYNALNEPLVPDIGQSTPIQLVKTYTKGTHTSQRIIQAIYPNQLELRVDGVVYSEYTADEELGTLTPTTTWPAGTYTWSGTFDVWVHFVEDYNPFSASDLNHWTAPILLVEARQR